LTGKVPEVGYLPGEFHWGAFVLGYAIMTAGLFVRQPAASHRS
jgi:hypothetical protein